MSQPFKTLSLKRGNKREKNNVSNLYGENSALSEPKNNTHRHFQNFRDNNYYPNHGNYPNHQHYSNYNYDNYTDYNNQTDDYNDYWNYDERNYQEFHSERNQRYMCRNTIPLNNSSVSTGENRSQEFRDNYSNYGEVLNSEKKSNYSHGHRIYGNETELGQTSDTNVKNYNAAINFKNNVSNPSRSVKNTTDSPKNSLRRRVSTSASSGVKSVSSSSMTSNVLSSDLDKGDLKKQDNRQGVPSENFAENLCSDIDKLLDKKVPSKKISHWLNPINSRDKAEVDRLVTQYSKSKKKENLLKLKLTIENEDCYEDNDHIFHNIEHLQEKINSTESQSPSIEDHEEGNYQEHSSLNEELPSKGTTKTKKRRKSNSSVSSTNSNDVKKDARVSSKSKSLLSSSPSITENAPELRSKQKRGRKKSRSSTDSFFCFKQPLLSTNDSETEQEENLLGKRRNSSASLSKSKKHKCSALECVEACVHETGKVSENVASTNNEIENSLIYDTNSIDDNQVNDGSNQSSNHNRELLDLNERELKINVFENANILDVEDLMKMFALKNVTIKKEFDDPLIDAMKNADVNFIFNASAEQPVSSKEIVPQVSDALPQPQNSSVEVLDKDMQINKLTEDSQQYRKPQSSIDPLKLTFPELSPFRVYVNISNELRKIQKEEEEKRSLLKDVDKQIDQYQKILNDLIAKKIKLQTEEENLISRRSNLTSALAHCITSDSFIKNSTSSDDNNPALPVDLKSEPNSSSAVNNALLEVVTQVSREANIKTTNVSNISKSQQNDSTCIISTNEAADKKKSLKSENNSKMLCKSVPDKLSEKQKESDDEVVIIPLEPKIVDIPIIDLEDQESPTKKSRIGIKCSEDQSKITSGSNFHNFKNITAHETVVNSLKVFNGYLYTCSNDYTAKRFKLENCSQTVTYKHSKRNVLELCVETFRNSTLVFTLCSAEKHITSFNAEDGVLMEVYNFEFPVRSISNGWSKIYAGLNNGTVMVCSWKESKDLVRNLEPIKSMACTIQGGLHVLVILSFNGQVAVRDVERNGLLIRYIKAHSDTPLFMDVYNDYVYLSSSVLLTASNLSTGAIERKIKLTSPITGLAAFENNIFTTSFSGLIRCYIDGKVQKMKMAYGAGKNSLTCIYVYQGWVFSGNRNGEVAAFMYDPFTEFLCHYGNCCFVFTRIEDLEWHVLYGRDHIIPDKSCTCPWRGCKTVIDKDWTEKIKKDHFKAHVTSSLQWKCIS